MRDHPSLTLSLSKSALRDYPSLTLSLSWSTLTDHPSNPFPAPEHIAQCQWQIVSGAFPFTYVMLYDILLAFQRFHAAIRHRHVGQTS